ncbi:YqzE family protein [Paenibacillus humicola]|uniref:YqzE family protein n=1 Tax=Paenibacillus humicola TaxID=3110540 RepID=UPI00237C26A4|nr:YqzE family protein [Paenibacillus humicola]
MASRDELIKYMTERVVAYIDTPREERKKNRVAAKALKEPWMTRWFGMMPVGFALWWRGRGKRGTYSEDQR